MCKDLSDNLTETPIVKNLNVSFTGENRKLGTGNQSVLSSYSLNLQRCKTSDLIGLFARNFGSLIFWNYYRPHTKYDGRLYFQFLCLSTLWPYCYLLRIVKRVVCLMHFHAGGLSCPLMVWWWWYLASLVTMDFVTIH